MTKKDYILIADAIVDSIPMYLLVYGKQKEEVDTQLLRCVINAIGLRLHSQNSTFSKTEFRQHILEGIRCLSSQD